MEFKGNLKQAEDDDVMIDERDKITKFVRNCKSLLTLDIKKHNKIPPTTLQYYKFIKMIG